MGSKLHGWIRGALAWGVAREYLEFNVADGIGAALPAARKVKTASCVSRLRAENTTAARP